MRMLDDKLAETEWNNIYVRYKRSNGKGIRVRKYDIIFKKAWSTNRHSKSFIGKVGKLVEIRDYGIMIVGFMSKYRGRINVYKIALFEDEIEIATKREAIPFIKLHNELKNLVIAEEVAEKL
jgi:hypothetical protein